MAGVVAFTVFAMGVLASLGLFMSGVAALRQARLAKRMFNLRYPSKGKEFPDGFDFSTTKASNSNG